MEPILKLYRKRYLPNESILLKDDNILFADDKLIVTSWKTLKPRKDISYGYSAYFMDQGFKVSKMFHEDGHLVYWYCDIIDTEYHKETNTYVFQDLLADVLIYPDGSVQVVDLDEIANLLEANVIDAPTVSKALRILNELLQLIYQGKFKDYQKIINNIEEKA